MFTTSSSGSDYAQTNRNRILSDAIPARDVAYRGESGAELAPPINPYGKMIRYASSKMAGRGEGRSWRQP